MNSRKSFYHISSVCVLILVTTVETIAQSGSNRLNYMNMLPPSPAAASISNFERPDVGLVSGTAQFQVPLTTIEMPGLTIPIGLNYSSNGVKVNDIAGRVGMSWRLETGGVITRTVMGSGADERTSHYSPPENTNENSRDFYNYLYNVSSTAHNDPQPDIFNYSIVGMSGQFVLDSADVPVAIPKTNAKIVMVWQQTEWEITITDPNGNEFYFGGAGFVEKTKTEQSCGRNYDDPEKTAFFLRKIKLYNNEEITFHYQTLSYQYDLGVNQSMNYSTSEQNSVNDMYPNVAYKCPILPLNTTCVSVLNVVETKYLTSIQSRTKTVEFTYTSRLDYGDVLLDKVIVNTPGVSVNEVFDLSYDYYHTTLLPSTGVIGNGQHRYFLKKVTKTTDAQNSEEIQLYQFAYNNPQQLPIRLSYAQDHWGYFNGKQNANFIPAPANPDLASLFPNANADREPDTIKSQLGMLVRVQYPTGGYDSIKYEANKYHSTKTIYPTTPASHIGGPWFGTGNPMVESHYGTFTLGFDQKVSIFVRSTKTAGVIDPIHDSGAIRIARTFGEGGTFLGVGTEQGTNQVTFLLPAGTYNVYLQASGFNTKTESNITYYPGPLEYVTKDWPVGGVRVRKVESFSDDGTFATMKRFWYATKDNLYHSSASTPIYFDYSKHISYDYFVTRYDQYGYVFACVSRNCQYSTLLSSTTTNIFSATGNSLAYQTILETPADNLHSGFIEHKFAISHDVAPTILLGNAPLQGALSNFSIYNNGREVETTYFKVENGLNKPVKRTRNVYQFRPELYQSFTGCLINRFYDEVCAIGQGQAEHYEMAKFEASRYSIESPWMALDSVIEETYQDGWLLKTFKKYEYTDFVSLQATQITTINSTGKAETTFNYYPTMKETIPNINLAQSSHLGVLELKNKISDLVYQELRINDNFTGSYRVMYDVFAPNQLVFPKEVQVNYSPNVIGKTFLITRYDAYGNPLERIKEDGIKSVYLWDYNARFPVAQITGAEYDHVAATSFESDGTGNWSISQGNVSTDLTAPTGEKVFTLGSLTKSSLDPGRVYHLSYSFKTGATVNVAGGTNSAITSTPGNNGWTHVMMSVSDASAITVTGSGKIDEVRLYPAAAQISTITYNPQQGTTSVTDTNNDTRYFSYDTFGRLKTVRDLDRYLLSTYRYHYKNNAN